MTIRGITTCKVQTGPGQFCNKTFSGPTYAMIGQGKHSDVIRYMNEVQQHFIKEHPEESEATQNRSLEFLTMLRMMNFQTTDSELKEQVQFLRWQILQQVLPIRLRDEKLKGMANQYAGEMVDLFILEVAHALGVKILDMIPKATMDTLKVSLHEKIAVKTVATIGELRDLYEEPGRFNIEVVPLVKPEGEAEKAETPPGKPLLVLP